MKSNAFNYINYIDKKMFYKLISVFIEFINYSKN